METFAGLGMSIGPAFGGFMYAVSIRYKNPTHLLLPIHGYYYFYSMAVFHFHFMC